MTTAALPRNRIAALAATFAVEAALIAALVFGLAGKLPQRVAESIRMFEVAPPEPPPPPKIVPRHVKSAKPSGKAAPPALKAKAAMIVAPPPLIVPDIPPPVVAALTAGTGSAAAQGAAPRPGPGTGAGGEGDGTGSGGSGDGEGDGGIPSRWVSGLIRDSDYPRAAYDAKIGGTVYLRFTVGTNGRITDCAVTKSSGNADLDEVTCRLLMARSRYKPARDPWGRKVPDVWTGEHVWSITPLPDRPERDASGAP